MEKNIIKSSFFISPKQFLENIFNSLDILLNYLKKETDKKDIDYIKIDNIFQIFFHTISNHFFLKALRDIENKNEEFAKNKIEEYFNIFYNEKIMFKLFTDIKKENKINNSKIVTSYKNILYILKQDYLHILKESNVNISVSVNKEKFYQILNKLYIDNIIEEDIY